MTVKIMTILDRSVLHHLLLLFAVVLPAFAVKSVNAENQAHDINDIRKAAENFALKHISQYSIDVSRVTATANSIDPRLRLAVCDIALETFSMTSSENMGRTTVGVRCNGNSPWTLYVPVQVDARVEVLITNRYFQRGESPTMDTLELKEIALSEAPAGYLTNSSQLSNKELLRNIQPGDVLSNRLLRAKELIKRGQAVVIHASIPGIDVKMNGIALESGTSGQLISVQNKNSGRTIHAIVQEDSSVVVRM